jgi:hypothetical protein
LIEIESDIDWWLFIISFPSSPYTETVRTIFAAKKPTDTFDICSNAVSNLMNVIPYQSQAFPLQFDPFTMLPRVWS